MTWRDEVGKKMVALVLNIIEEVKKEDTVQVKWHVSKTTTAIVWCDAWSRMKPG